MKKLIVVFLLLSITGSSTVVNGQYYNDALSAKNSQYEGGLDEVRNTYHFLINLQLVNKYNIPKLQQYKDFSTDLINKPEWKQADYSLPQNVASICTAINQYQDDQGIKAEMHLLSEIWDEMEAMKQNSPGSFTSTDRYKELKQVINDLQDCQPSEIRGLGIKHGIF